MNHERVSVRSGGPDPAVLWPVENRCLEAREEGGCALEKTEVGGMPRAARIGMEPDSPD